MKKEWVFVFALAAVFISLGVSIASFNFNGQSIKTNYLAGDNISGTLNISFNNEPSQSLITSSLGGSIILSELLKRNNFVLGTDYNCSIPNCSPGNIAQGQISTLSIGQNDSKIFAFVVSGKEVEIKSFNITINSDTPQSCIRQALVDILNKGENFVQNPSYTNNVCDYTYFGCFDQNLSPDAYTSLIIPSGTATTYCEKVTLPPAAAYQMGAIVQNTSTGSSELQMRLYDSNWNKKADCTLPELTTQIGELNCIVNYSSVGVKDYFVCLMNPQGAGTDYHIRSETSGQKCGVVQAGSTDYTRDFEIFARAMQFDSVNIKINDKTFGQGTSLVSYMNDYLDERYQKDCSSGCVVPFRVSGKQQTISFSNAQMDYTAIEGGGVIPYKTNKVYSAISQDAVINSNNLNIELAPAGLVIPLNLSGQQLLEIRLVDKNGSNVLFSNLTNVSVSFGFDVVPKSALIGVATEFDIISPFEVTSSWDFGDSTTGIANKSIFHRYSAEGNYNIRVEATKSDGTRAVKSFTISVGDPKESASRMLDIYNSRLANIISQIAAFPDWVSKELESKVDTIGLKTTLNQIKGDFDVATTDDDYRKVVDKLVGLDVPEAISISRSGNIPLLSGFQNIDTSAIEEISNQNTSEKDKLKADIVSWMNNNYGTDVQFEVISKFTDGKETPLFSKFDIKITPKASITEQTYFVINYPQEAIKFKQTYSDRPAGSAATYLTLGNSAEEVEFMLPDSVEVSNLGAYISPDMRSLGTYESIEIVKKTTPIGTILFWWGVLIILTLGAYIALQEWYKRYYEDYLFENKDDIYNLINFIYNSRVAELKDAEIAKKLAEKGWKGEQITYAFKKIDGKRTGMYEIPIFKFIENIKVRKEIEKRQKKPIDTKFIKRPELKK